MDVGPDIAQQGMQFPMDVPPTLVKFDPPIFAGLEPSSEANNNRSSNNSGNEPGGGSRGGGGKGNNGHQGKTSQLDDMVNSMLPPREWTEETGTWMQYVSKEPATRLAVITLQVSSHIEVGRRLNASCWSCNLYLVAAVDNYCWCWSLYVNTHNIAAPMDPYRLRPHTSLALHESLRRVRGSDLLRLGCALLFGLLRILYLVTTGI